MTPGQPRNNYVLGDAELLRAFGIRVALERAKGDNRPYAGPFATYLKSAERRYAQTGADADEIVSVWAFELWEAIDLYHDDGAKPFTYVFPILPAVAADYYKYPKSFFPSGPWHYYHWSEDACADRHALRDIDAPAPYLKSEIDASGDSDDEQTEFLSREAVEIGDDGASLTEAYTIDGESNSGPTDNRVSNPTGQLDRENLLPQSAEPWFTHTLSGVNYLSWAGELWYKWRVLEDTPSLRRVFQPLSRKQGALLEYFDAAASEHYADLLKKTRGLFPKRRERATATHTARRKAFLKRLRLAAMRVSRAATGQSPSAASDMFNKRIVPGLWHKLDGHWYYRALVPGHRPVQKYSDVYVVPLHEPALCGWLLWVKPRQWRQYIARRAWNPKKKRFEEGWRSKTLRSTEWMEREPFKSYGLDGNTDSEVFWRTDQHGEYKERRELAQEFDAQVARGPHPSVWGALDRREQEKIRIPRPPVGEHLAFIDKEFSSRDFLFAGARSKKLQRGSLRLWLSNRIVRRRHDDFVRAYKKHCAQVEAESSRLYEELTQSNRRLLSSIEEGIRRYEDVTCVPREEPRRPQGVEYWAFVVRHDGTATRRAALAALWRVGEYRFANTMRPNASRLRVPKQKRKPEPPFAHPIDAAPCVRARPAGYYRDIGAACVDSRKQHRRLVAELNEREKRAKKRIKLVTLEQKIIALVTLLQALPEIETIAARSEKKPRFADIYSKGADGYFV